jgi:hypothetical protein
MARGGTAEEILKSGVLQELVRSSSGAVSNRIRFSPLTPFFPALDLTRATGVYSPNSGTTAV